MSMTEKGLRPPAPVEELDEETLDSLERTRQFARINRFKYAQGRSLRQDSKPRLAQVEYRKPYAD